MTEQEQDISRTQRRRRRYPSDVTDHEGGLIAPVLAPSPGPGRPRPVDLRAIINGIISLNRTGAPGEMMPPDFPGWSHGDASFRTWTRDGTWRRINTARAQKVRRGAGKLVAASAAIIDSQRVKPTEAGGPRGFDAHTMGNGRKRPLVVATLGLRLRVVVHRAAIQEPAGAKLALTPLLGRLPRLVRLWADGLSQGPLGAWVRETWPCVHTVVRRAAGPRGLQALPKRWIVERRLGWLHRSRRLSQAYERAPQMRESMVYRASSRRMRRRLEAAKRRNAARLGIL